MKDGERKSKTFPLREVSRIKRAKIVSKMAHFGDNFTVLGSLYFSGFQKSRGVFFFLAGVKFLDFAKNNYFGGSYFGGF